MCKWWWSVVKSGGQLMWDNIGLKHKGSGESVWGSLRRYEEWRMRGADENGSEG